MVYDVKDHPCYGPAGNPSGTNKEKVAAIQRWLTELRLDCFGGYPAEWTIANVDGVTCLIEAEAYEGRVSLEIIPVEDFIVANEDILQDIIDEYEVA